MDLRHYFSPTPDVPSLPRTVRLSLPDVQLQLVTDRGVFAYGAVDRGTDLLLRTAPNPVGGELLDLGCGYGAVAITLAKRCPGCRVWAVDVNRRALALCAENARRAGAGNVTVVPPDAVPKAVRFRSLYSNPPIRVGKQRLHELLGAWLDRLEPDASGYLVVQRALGSDSLLAWLAGRGHRVERLRSRGGYRVLEVHACSGSAHHGDRDA